MSADWISFGVIIFAQAVFLVLSAIYYKKLSELPRLLLYGIIVGTVLGLLYDNILGRYFSLFTYKLGFEATFLMLNASLSYSLFVTSTLLIQKVSAINFTVWLSMLIIIYEVTNLFYPVWSYNFSLPLLPFFILCLVGYSYGALVASFISKIVFKQPFALEIER